jgi:hypothetical protein
MLRKVRGMTYRGNLAYNNVGVGFELRPLLGTSITVLQNTAIRNGAQGLSILTAGTAWNVKNNACAFNQMRDFSSGGLPAGGNNWAKDGLGVLAQYAGDPKVVNDHFVLDMDFDHNLSVRAKWQIVESRIRNALSPKAHSGLVDAGQVIPGYHCPRADDDPVAPMPKSDPRRHWYGHAPDIGAFEFNP